MFNYNSAWCSVTVKLGPSIYGRNTDWRCFRKTMKKISELNVKKLRYSYPCNRIWRPIGV
jgi:hypothetical protein